jgi:hypothetical protein
MPLKLDYLSDALVHVMLWNYSVLFQITDVNLLTETVNLQQKQRGQREDVGDIRSRYVSLDAFLLLSVWGIASA